MGVDVYPSEKLKNPEAQQPIPDLVNTAIGGFADFISATYWVKEGLKLFGLEEQVNDFENTAYGVLGGNWEDIAKAADAMRKLGEYVEEFGKLYYRSFDIDTSSWQGNAAMDAEKYFRQASKDIQSLKDEFDAVAEQIQNAANSAYFTAQGVQTAIETVIDSLIGVAISLAAAAVTSETGVGGVVGVGAAAAFAARAAGSLSKAKKMLDAFEMFANVQSWTWGGAQFIGGIGGTARSGMNDISLSVKVPSAYNNTCVD